MKRLLMSLLINSAVAMTATAQGHELLVGSYTEGRSEGIYRYRFDSQRGHIAPVPLQVVSSVNPSWLVVSGDRRLLFAVNENGAGRGQVSSFAISPGSGVLSPLNRIDSLGDEPTHASLSDDGHYLFVANYAVQPTPGGSLSVLPVAADGRLLPVVQQERHPPSYVNPERQAGSHVHAAVLSPDGRYVFACDLGADKVFVYRYDRTDPEHPLSPASPASVSLPPGSGPRHLVFAANGRQAYLTLEMSAEVVVFDARDGSLVERQRLPLSDTQDPASKAAGALHLSPDGRFLYVSNRGTANELRVFAIDPAKGTLTPLQRRSVEGDHPREFTLDPSGDYVLVANQKSNEIVVIQRDRHTGLLGKTVQKLAQDAPSDLKFVN